MKITAALIFLMTSTQVLSANYFGAPFVSKLNGLDPFYGAIIGAKNILKKDDQLIAAYSLGSVDKTYVIGAQNIHLTSKWKLSLGLANSDETTLETNYSRSLDPSRTYQQKIELNAMMISIRRILSKNSDLKLSFGKVEKKFLGYENLDDNKINISMNDFFDEESSIINLEYSYKGPKKRFDQGVKYNLGLLHVSGRTGQSDMLTIDNKISYHLPLAANQKVVLFGKSSNAFVLKQYKTTGSDIDGNCSAQTTATSQARCEELEADINRFITEHNRYGTAKPIGGNAGLRGYREFRFKSAHTLLTGFEYDWMFLESPEIHIVPFFELGQANDRFENMWDEYRYSAGISLRPHIKGIPLRLTGTTGSEGQAFFLAAGAPF